MNQALFYPLFDQFDQDFFNLLVTAVKDRYELIGNDKEKEYFIKTLLVFQMLKDYRAPLVVIYENLGKQTDIAKINQHLQKQNYDIDYTWAVWKRDKTMGKLAVSLFNSTLEILGTDQDFNEFVLRYLISIWLVDWEGPLYAILQETKDKTVDLKSLNQLLTKWDFTNIFGTY